MKKLLILLPLVLLLSCKGAKEDPVLHPNIVLIMADDLGYGGISPFGNTDIKTPNLALLAKGGVKFTDFHSNGAVCSPTRAALMTGKYQQRTGVSGVVTAKSHRDVGLHLDEITIAEELKSEGYNCGMYGKWHLGYAKEFNPTLQGFDEFTGFVSGNVDYHAHIDQEGYLDWWKGDKIDNEEGYTTDLITDYGVKFIEANNPEKTKKPFFLYLPHEAPHGPYQRRIDKVLRTVGTAGSEAVDKDSISSIYKEMVEVMDEGIGKVMQALKESGQYENTIFLFLSDNGANHYGSNGGLRGHKGGVYEGGSRVPAIISYPGVLEAGTVNEETLLTMDVMPTLLDFIGKRPTGDKIDGVSFKDNLLEDIAFSDRDVFFAYNNKSFVRRGDWKLVCIDRKGEDALELYNLDVDIAEKEDVSAENPKRVKELYDRLKIWEKEVSEGVTKVSG